MSACVCSPQISRSALMVPIVVLVYALRVQSQASCNPCRLHPGGRYDLVPSRSLASIRTYGIEYDKHPYWHCPSRDSLTCFGHVCSCGLCPVRVASAGGEVQPGNGSTAQPPVSEPCWEEVTQYNILRSTNINYNIPLGVRPAVWMCWTASEVCACCRVVGLSRLTSAVSTPHAPWLVRRRTCARVILHCRHKTHRIWYRTVRHRTAPCCHVSLAVPRTSYRHLQPSR